MDGVGRSVALGPPRAPPLPLPLLLLSPFSAVDDSKKRGREGVPQNATDGGEKRGGRGKEEEESAAVQLPPQGGGFGPSSAKGFFFDG